MRIRSAVTAMALSLCAGCSSTALVRPTAGETYLGGHPGATLGLTHGVHAAGAADEVATDSGDVAPVQPLIEQPKIDEVLSRFRRQRSAAVQVALSRGAQYIDMIARELRREGVPPELAYLPIVESGFAVRARGGSAVGMWQMTPDTARRYGLLVSSEVDERCDPEKSTRAAARMLRDLYDTFADWELAIAAYNAGPGRVQKALERRPEAGFWELADSGLLPATTREYVPSVLAAMKLGTEDLPTDSAAIGSAIEPLRYDTYLVARRLDFQTIASLAGSQANEIADLNPHLTRGIVPARPEGYPVKLPEGTASRFEQNYLALVSASPEDLEAITPRVAGGRGSRSTRLTASSRRAGASSVRGGSGRGERRIDSRRSQRI